MGTLSGLTIQGLLVASNGSAISNLNASNIIGTVRTAVAVTGNAQPNITSVGTLSSLAVSGLITGTGQALSSLQASNIVGAVASSNLAVAVTGNSQPNITSVGTLTSLVVSGKVTAGSFAGDGSALSNLQVSNLVGTIGYATMAGGVTENAQPNITSVGTLSSLAVSGTLSAGAFIGNAAGLSNIQGSNIVGPVSLALSVSGAAQPNITSVGTLSSLAVSGLITGTGQALSSLQASNIVGVIASSNLAVAVTGNAQPNITSVGTLSSLSVSTSLSAGVFLGNASGLSNLQASNLVGSVPIAASVTANAQPNITSVGILSNLAVSNSVTTTNIFANFANVSGKGIFGNLGIGTSNPIGQFEISSPLPNQNVSMYLSDGATGLGNGSAIIKDSSQNLLISNYQNADIILASSGNDRIRMYAGGGQAIVGPLGVGSSMTSPSVTGATLQVTGNIYASNALTTTNVFATIYRGDGGLLSNIAILSNLVVSNSLTTTNVFATIYRGDGGLLSNINTTPGLLPNLVVSNSVTTTNIFFQNAILNTNLPVFNGAQGTWGSSANVSQVTVDQYGRVSAAANVGILSSQWTNIDGNVAYQNGVSIGTLSNPPPGSNLYVLGKASVGSLNASAISNLNSLTTPIANVGTLNVWQISNLNSLSTNLLATMANVGTLNVWQISNLNSLSTNLLATMANVGTLNVWQISNLNSLTTNLFATTANVGTLNVSTLESVTQLNAGNVTVSNSVTVSNLVVSSNILPGSAGNTYVVGNVVVSGNVYSSLGELGVGGSLFFSLGSPLTPAIQYTGTVPVAGTTTYGLSLTPFTKQGASTYTKVSANGCFQFNQTGVYTVSGIFMTNSNNVLGIGIGSNVIDYGTRTDQSYLYSLVPFISQNPTSVLETQFYVSSTSLYYYIDLFSVDGTILQPTSNLSGGTWVSISPLGGISAASTTVTLSTLGNIVTGQASSYGASIFDYYIGCATGPMTITLPLGGSLAAGKTYVVKDESGTATTRHITIAATSPNLIDGSSTAILSINYAAVTVLWTGTVWSII